MNVRRLVAIFLVLSSFTAAAQTKWYKFNKAFVNEHFTEYSAIGELQANESHPAKKAHSVNCGGNDGELHIGIPGEAVVWSKASGQPISALADDAVSDFGLVAEPPNVTAATVRTIQGVEGNPIEFYGFFRVWNEGHDAGPIYPSNPHHVLEVHPVWGLHSGTVNFVPNASVVFPMPRYSGYGASHFRKMLTGVPQWLKVAEDDDFVYVQLQKADNFYQLPVVVKQTKPLAGGRATLVDVYSDVAHQNRIYQDLTVVSAQGSSIASRLQPGQSTYLLGFFSVNLAKAMYAARGHRGITEAVPAPFALEFFAFGVPLQTAVASSNPCVEEQD